MGDAVRALAAVSHAATARRPGIPVIAAPGGFPDADVCVVGAGPAGLVLANALGAAGWSVVVVESGPLHVPGRRDLNDGDVCGEAYAGLQATRNRQVGGTPHVWNVEVDGEPGAKYVPLGARDLEGWPITREGLEPFYRQAQEVCGLGPFDYRAESWATPDRRPFRLAGTDLASGVYHFGSARSLTQRLVETVLRSPMVHLIPSTTVVGLGLDRGGSRVTEVRAVHPSAGRITFPVRRVVLACGAVENARQLLLPPVRHAVPTPWVGRGFMEHARDFSMTLVPSSPRVFAEASFYDVSQPGDGPRVGGWVGPSEDACQDLDVPAAAATLIPASRPNASGAPRPPLRNRVLRAAVRVAGRRPPGRYGWSAVPWPSRMYDVFGLVLNIEQRPLQSNRVELGKRRDRFDTPLPCLHLTWTEVEQARLERLRAVLADGFREAGLGQLRYQPGHRPDLSAHHHAGTTRMAHGPAEGVVDPNGRVWGLENLWVSGASTFPTAGFANPTLTIVALALRVARHLAGDATTPAQRAAPEPA